MEIFFSDVDKTLVDSPKDFSEEIINAISKCHDNSIEFIMCSGRPTANLINEALNLNNHGAKINYVCGFNGSQLYDINDKKYVYSNDLSKDEVYDITNVLKNYGLDYLIYKDEMIFGNNILNKHALHEKEICKLKMQSTSEIFSSPKVLGLIDEEKVVIYFEEIKEKLSNYTVTMSMPFFIEITKKDVDKGSGVINTAKYLGVKLEDVTVFGDGGNDINMFLLKDVKKICVSNAVDIIKKNSDEIINSVYDNGVAKYIMSKISE